MYLMFNLLRQLL